MDISKLLPQHVPVELPSRGKFYKDSDLSDGWVYIREYAAPEESLLSQANARNFQRVINSIIDSCMKSDTFKAENLTSADAFYLLVWLRGVSYGPIYSTNFTCPDCQVESSQDVNLSGLNYKYLDMNEDYPEPIVVELPKTGLTVKLRIMRRKFEISAVERAPDVKKFRKVIGNPVELLKRAYAISELIFPGEETTPITNYIQIEEICTKGLPSADSLLIDEALNKYDHGVDLDVSLTCSACGAVNDTSLPWGPEFFRASRLSLSEEGESTIGNFNLK